MISLPTPEEDAAAELDRLREENKLLKQRQADLKEKIQRQADVITRNSRTIKSQSVELRKLRGAKDG